MVLNLLNTLNSAGYDVTLITSRPEGLDEANDLFHKTVNNVNIHKIKTLPFLPHPYTIAYLAKKATIEKNYDLFIILDDIPKYLCDKNVINYVQYLHAARFKFREYTSKKYVETLKGKLNWRIHQFLFPKFFQKQYNKKQWLLLVNSTLTMNHTSKTLNCPTNQLTLLFPPVATDHINKYCKNNDTQKMDLAICIGRFEPSKMFDEVITALSLIKKTSTVQLCIIGVEYGGTYLRKLEEQIINLGLDDRVELLLNADRDILLDKLAKAKVIVHPALYEPFGIAVVEGMAAGCIPLVKKGINGPWMDITKEGKYGLGFETVEELALSLETAIKDYDYFNIDSIASRAFEFEESKFKDEFLIILKKFLTENHL